MSASGLAGQPPDLAVGSKTARHLPWAILVVSLAIWTGMIVMRSSHTALPAAAASPGARLTAASALAFLAGWEAMVIAMMLPSSIRFFSLLGLVAGGRARRRAGVAKTAAHAGYALVWAAIGGLVMLLSFSLHRLATVDSWLSGHQGLFAGAVLLLAGGFQFTALKWRCLLICSRPESFLMRHYNRGSWNALRLGVRYGTACVGCCWAMTLALVMLGAGSLYGMLAASAIMFIERALGWNAAFTKSVGLACIGLGIIVAAYPAAVPALAHNASAWLDTDPLFARLHESLFWCH